MCINLTAHRDMLSQHRRWRNTRQRIQGCSGVLGGRPRACGRMLLVELHTNLMEPATFQGLLEKLHNQSRYMKVTEVILFQFRQWHEVTSTCDFHL